MDQKVKDNQSNQNNRNNLLEKWWANKQIFSLLLILMLLALGLTGCTADPKKEVAPTTTAKTATAESSVSPGKTDSAASSTDAPVLAKDKPAPDFQLKDLNGKTVKLSDYKGKYVLINFWATWCKFCRVEIPDLMAFDKANDDIVVLAVDYMESKDTVQKFLEKNKFKMNTLLDEDGAIGALYAVSSFPTTYILDSQGNLVAGIQGMTTKEELETVKKYLHETYPK